jgi:hypothetical protein
MDYRDHLQKIEKLAYKLWEREGRPEGRAMTNWLRAEKMLSDDAFLEHEIEVEEEEGGLVRTPDGKTSPPLGGRVKSGK